MILYPLIYGMYPQILLGCIVWINQDILRNLWWNIAPLGAPYVPDNVITREFANASPTFYNKG